MMHRTIFKILISIYIIQSVLLLSSEIQCSAEPRSDLNGIWSELVIRSATKIEEECKTCMKAISSIITDNIVRTSRVESIKRAILERLGMSEPPTINASQLSLPYPIRNGDIMNKDNDEDIIVQHDGTAVTPNKVMIISSETSARETENGFEIVSKMEVPWNVQTAELTVATLWLYAGTNRNLDACNLYSKPCGSTSNKYRTLSTNYIDYKDDWSQLDITTDFVNWLEYEEFCQDLKLNCSGTITEIYVASRDDKDSNNKPFITINLIPFSTVNRNRNKRNINCVTSSTDCCRERLLVSFAQIKWDNWIIKPSSYEAYYCKGKCDDIATISLGNTPYYSVLHKLRLNTEIRRKLPELRTCCAPTSLTPLQIIYVNQNGTFLEATIPNMSVTSCGCT